MKHFHKARLKKLADHLINGKLGHKKFDFNDWNRGNREQPAEPYKCGFAGCAIGECPIVFPLDWKFDEYADPVLRRSWLGITDSAESFFGIDYEAVRHLFMPNCQTPEVYGGKRLGGNATAKRVGENILAFLEKQA